MPFSVGDKLGPYEITGAIGAGGMGEVYRARDQRLGRQVALKILPPAFSTDPDRVLRFEQEGRAAAAINHPNVVAIYDAGSDGGVFYVATELLEGETLRARLNGSPLPVRKAIEYAIQIARGLAAAHAKGIVHRDLKPENLFVAKDGLIKILDFGLAKQLVTKQAVAHAAERSTETILTDPGVVLGTTGYMSPEQVRGEAVDTRSDIFSFGVILYEMLAGKRAFAGDTPVDVLIAILKQDAPELPESVPPGVRQIVQHCLEKEPVNRFQSARDLGFALSPPVTASGAASALAKRRMWPKWAAIVVTAAALGLVVGLFFERGAPPQAWFALSRSPLLRPQPKPRKLTGNAVGNPATDPHISPDGRYLAYADQAGIHLQLVDTGETRTIPPPQDVGYKVTGWSPVGWFPDGTKLLVQATSLGAEHSSVWTISMLGGAPREIHEGALAWSVSPDGSLIAFTSGPFDSDIWLMGPNGESPRRTIVADEGESLISVVWSPGGRRIAYERLRWGPSGALCSIESRNLKGDQPATVLSDPKLTTGFGRGGFCWLGDGRLVYSVGEAAPPNPDVTAPGFGTSDTNLWEIRVDDDSGKSIGKPRRITSWADFSLTGLNATADGKRLVFSRVSARSGVYVGDLEAQGVHLRAPPRRLTLDEYNDWPTAWTPDSEAIFFFSDRSGKYDIYKQALAEESVQLFVTTSRVSAVPRLSADGAWILYDSFEKIEDVGTLAPSQLWRVAVSGGPSQLVLTKRGWADHRCARAPATLCLMGEPTEDQKQTILTEFDPIKGRGREVTRISGREWDLSPDGSHIVFLTGQNRIRLQPLRGGESRDLIVNGWYGFRRGPNWSSDGKGFYVGVSSARGATLLYIDLKGHAIPVWEQKGSFDAWADPSPDGVHLAMMGWTVDSNVWMLEGF